LGFHFIPHSSSHLVETNSEVSFRTMIFLSLIFLAFKNNARHYVTISQSKMDLPIINEIVPERDLVCVSTSNYVEMQIQARVRIRK